jgi:hypothetical protein
MTICNHRGSEIERDRERERESTIHEHIVIHSCHQKDMSCSAHSSTFKRYLHKRKEQGYKSDMTQNLYCRVM